MPTEPERATLKIATALTGRAFREGWSRTDWTNAIEKELDRYRDEIEEIRHCDKCDLCEDHNAD